MAYPNALRAYTSQELADALADSLRVDFAKLTAIYVQIDETTKTVLALHGHADPFPSLAGRLEADRGALFADLDRMTRDGETFYATLQNIMARAGRFGELLTTHKAGVQTIIEAIERAPRG